MVLLPESERAGGRRRSSLRRSIRLTDEAFIVLEGVLRIDFRDGAVQVSAGKMFVVPKGVEHKPYAEHEVKLLLIEPRGVLNTGHEGGDRAAEDDVWI
jgi:mannose-6-phosphate isomerase-like protein (cupin superfamily)